MFLANGMAVASFIARIPDIQTDLGLREATLGLVLPGVSIGVIAGLLLSGWLIPRTGSRRLMLVGAAVAVTTLPLAGFASNALLLAAVLVVLGLGGSAMDVGMNAQGVGIERGYGRSIMVGMHAAYSVGTLLGALGGSVATVTRTPVATHLLIVALVISVIVVIASRWLSIDDVAAPGTPAHFAIPRGALFPLALIAFAAALGENTAASWSGLHLRDTVAVPTAQVGWGYVTYTAAMVMVRVFGDRLVVRFGRQRVVSGGGLLAATGFVLMASVPTLATTLIGLMMIGFGLGTTVPLAFATAGRVARTPGEGVAAVASVGYLAFLVGPPTVGILADTIGLSVGFVLVAVVIAALTTRRLPVQ